MQAATKAEDIPELVDYLNEVFTGEAQACVADMAPYVNINVGRTRARFDLGWGLHAYAKIDIDADDE